MSDLFDVLFNLFFELRVNQGREGFNVLQVVNGSEILLGPAFTFTKDNIDNFDF